MSHRIPKERAIAALICAAVVFWVCQTIYERHAYVQSSNANFEGDVSTLDAQLTGTVSEVLAREQEPVRKGQILCVIDDRRYRAALADAVSTAEASRIVLDQRREDFARASALWRERSRSRSAFDHARFALKQAEDDRTSALAGVARARLDLAHTRIRAPRDGVLAFRVAEPGMYVRPGVSLFGFVDNGRRWVIARVHETDLRDVRPGAEARVELDAAPGRDFHGKVEIIGPSTEAPFAAIPPDRASGNFTRYVQWVPIRVALSLSAEDGARIPVGSSARIRLKRPS